MNSLSGFLKENNGQFSSARLIPFIMTVCMAVDWMHTVFTGGKYQPDLELVGMVVAAIAAKVAQKPLEKPAQPAN